MSRPAPRRLSISKTDRITPNMQRITLTGNDLSDFPQDQESGYVKLMFSDPHETRRLTRTYTIRAHNAGSNELVIDFALHDHTDGPASRWAKTANVGDQISVGGPGPKKLVNNDADWFFLVGDMTSLPAIACNLEQLPDTAIGYAVIEITAEADKQTIEKPNGIEIHWVVNPTPHIHTTDLLETVAALDWHAGKPSVWTACEFHSMRKLRSYFKETRAVAKDDIYISSYWKTNRTEDEHKQDKSEDQRQANAA